MQRSDEQRESPWTFDVSRQYIGTVYAKALLNVTEKQGKSEAVLDELGEFVAVLDKLPKLAAVLASPRVPLDDKLRMVDKAAAGADVDLVRFLKVVARRGRLDCLREIFQAARHQLHLLRHQVEVVVESAVPLDETQRQQIADQLRKSLQQDVLLDVRVRPELLAGLIVRIGDTVYDASVANQLTRLRDSMVEKMRQRIRQNPERLTVS
jgi:F-type H+-transporting ATPase subunit delta